MSDERFAYEEETRRGGPVRRRRPNQSSLPAVTARAELGGRSMTTGHGRDRWLLRWLKWTFGPPHASRTLAVWRQVDLRSLRVEPRRTARAASALRSIVRRPPRSGPIWAVSMVKNEADIIEESVQNLLDQGVDHVLIADNGSEDGTGDLLRGMGERLPVHVVEDPIVAYWQGEKVSHLARAATRMGAAWVIPFDADELWKGTGGRTVAQVLRSTPEDYAVASWWDFMPVSPVGGSTFAERYPFRDPVSRPQVKVAFRAHWLARVWFGSHHVTVPRQTSQMEVPRISHFQFRTPAQMVRKATDGARAARIAGENSADLPQWFGMEGATEADAAAWLEAMIRADQLVHDPATGW